MLFRSTQTGQHTELSEEERGGADGEDRALTAWVFLLDLGKVLENVEGLGFGLDDGLEIAAGDDQDVEFGQFWLDLGICCVSLEDDSVCGFDGWG